MKTVTITRISREEKTSKTGKPYESVGLQVKEVEGWINGFGGAWNKSWKEGDKVTLDLYKEEYNGKEYTKFRQVDMNMLVMMKIDRMEMMIKDLWKAQQKEADTKNRGYEYPDNESEEVPFEEPKEEDINPDDIPF